MRKIQFIPGQYYHIYNRGNNKQNIFIDNRDWTRFLFMILYFQFSSSFYNLGRQVSHFVRHRVFNINDELRADHLVYLVCFTLMPNHFHLIVNENKENGISQYMQRILNGYTKYFNTKYERSGHLFQGPFQAVHIENNEQLLYLSAYIHKNPTDINKWKNNELEYSWSSYQDYVHGNRWGGVLKRDIIINQFANGSDYQRYVRTSGAKGSKKSISADLLIDDA